MRFFRANPLLLLLLLSPGIPEYLSGSSPLSAIVLNPLQFLLQLAVNLGLYGPGVILVREAVIRWRKGWASILLLGAAYGILEEGTALSTLFNPAAKPVVDMHSYGHLWGVNWVWAAGIVPTHMIFSIALPIVLLGLALPETNGKSLVTSKKKIATLFIILAADVTALFLATIFSQRFWMGWPVFIFSSVFIGVLVYLAKIAPANLVHAKTDNPTISPLKIGALGVSFFIVVFLLFEHALMGRVPAFFDFLVVVGVEVLYLLYVLGIIGCRNNERQLVAFAGGLVAPLAFFGFISQWQLPIVLVADAAFAVFIYVLYQKYRAR